MMKIADTSFNEVNFLNEEVDEEFTSRPSQSLDNVRSPSYLKKNP